MTGISYPTWLSNCAWNEQLMSHPVIMRCLWMNSQPSCKWEPLRAVPCVLCLCLCLWRSLEAGITKKHPYPFWMANSLLYLLLIKLPTLLFSVLLFTQISRHPTDSKRIWSFIFEKKKREKGAVPKELMRLGCPWRCQFTGCPSLDHFKYCVPGPDII